MGIEQKSTSEIQQLEGGIKGCLIITEFIVLKSSPSNKLEKLRQNECFNSIRINDQWRIVFNGNDGNASECLNIGLS